MVSFSFLYIAESESCCGIELVEGTPTAGCDDGDGITDGDAAPDSRTVSNGNDSSPAWVRLSSIIWSNGARMMYSHEL